MRLTKILSLILIAAILPACRVAAPLGKTEPPEQSTAQNQTEAIITPKKTLRPLALPPSYPVLPPKLTQRTISGITFEGVSYDSRSHRLQVVDQSDGPGSQYSTSKDLAEKSQALLSINAGFFTPEGAPLGLVISGGKKSGGWNSASSLGSGIYKENISGNVGIVRRTSLSSVSNSRELLQAGPLLIENGNTVSGLNSKKSAIRSILLTDGSFRWWIGTTSPCSLNALAKALSNSSPAPWKTKTALNLDGGRSTDLFVSGKVAGGSLNRRSFLNRPVRNFLILKKK